MTATPDAALHPTSKPFDSETPVITWRTLSCDDWSDVEECMYRCGTTMQARGYAAIVEPDWEQKRNGMTKVN